MSPIAIPPDKAALFDKLAPLVKAMPPGSVACGCTVPPGSAERAACRHGRRAAWSPVAPVPALYPFITALRRVQPLLGSA
jgi:hypothetical protein